MAIYDFQGTVLVVDDDPVIHMLLSEHLATLGCRAVLRADGADQALGYLLSDSANSINLIICDLQMPGKDGIEFLRDILEHAPHTNLAFVSASDRSILRAAESLARQRGLNVVGALSKPIDLGEVEQVVQKVLAGRDLDAGDVLPEEPCRSAEWLNQAMSDDRIMIYCQPQVSMVSGELFGVEILVRGKDMDDAIVSPDQFVATAEVDGLMDVLTFRVLELASIARAEWAAAGIATRISVNFSASTLSRLDIPELVSQMSHPDDLKHFVVELTESSISAQPQDLLDVTSRLRLRGIHLSIDDFGIGFSSLSQLVALPFSELKLDLSFVKAALLDPHANAVVGNTINMAHDLGLIVVGEGVETRAHYDMLLALGCDIGQGYYIARPMPWKDLPKWVAARVSNGNTNFSPS